ncbi:MAG TPA: T9SS type A sorting domain-containing protein [Puia sp.]|nr:T9SS type A sorting domain-containing protein [Puia sp.]
MNTRLLLFCLFQLSGLALLAQPGTLDNSFAGNGKVATPIGNFGSQADAIAVQSDDGKIVVAGQYKSGANGFGDLFSFAVVRYTKTGGLDPDFGAGSGKVYYVLNNPFSGLASIAIQPDKKILLTGWTVDEDNSVPNLWLVRLNTDGSPDLDFNHTGTVLEPNFFGVGIVVQPDGKIVVGANEFSISTYTNNTLFAAMRFNADGTPDNLFGTGGRVVTLIGSAPGGPGRVAGIALAPGGKILVTGGYTATHIITLLYNSNGTLDGSFGSGGRSDITVNGNDGCTPSAIGVQSDGKIVIGGTYTSANGATNFLVVRMSSHGVPDNGFAGNGKKGVNFNGVSKLSGIALSPDGTIYAGGTTQATGQPPKFAFCRLLTDGSLDLIFGPDGDGKVIAGWSNAAGVGKGIAQQPDGKIVMTGSYSGPSQGSEFAAMRFLPAFKTPVQQVAITPGAINGTAAEIAPAGIRLFPNPATDRLQLTGLPTAGPIHVSVTDLSGKALIRGWSNGESSYGIDISRLAPGPYVIKLEGVLVTNMMFIKLPK